MRSASEYDTCKDYISINTLVPYQVMEPKRAFKIHVCFEKCRPDPKTQKESIDPGFTIDERPICDDKINKDQGIICVHPTKTECDILH